MTDYREIIRLHSLKFSNVSIANSLCCSRNTVSEVLKLAETHSLEWPIPETLSKEEKAALEKMQDSDNFKPSVSIKEKIFRKFRNFFD